MNRKIMPCLPILAPLVALALQPQSVLGSKEQPRWVAPAEAAALENPLSTTPQIVKAGKTLFTQQCSPCHGVSGRGDGPASSSLGKTLPDFTSSEFQAQTDGELFWKISHGNAPMPMFSAILSEEKRWTVVHFVRTLDASHQKGGNE